MKFGKDFKRKRVPEWTEAYMDYNGLKRVLGDVTQYKQSVQLGRPLRNLQRTASYLSVSGFYREPTGSPRVDANEKVIDIDALQPNGSGRYYVTNFLRQLEGGGEIEARFFRMLDEELNKVNTFFKKKVKEVMQEANSLNKQIDALVALRIKVARPGYDGSSSETPSNSGPCTESMASNDIKGEGTGTPYMIYQGERCREEMNVHSQDPFEMLDHVKMNNTLESPVSMLKGLFRDSKDVDLRFKKEELRKAEERLRVVFIVFYQKLHHLRLYSFMNLSAFAKILKKYEKISSRRAKKAYMEIVDNSYVGSSDEVINLLERVEAIFITHLSNSNRKKAMESLRPKAKKENHKVTFFTGFFCGCSVALVVAIILKIEARNLMERVDDSLYMQNIFPLYSLLGFIILHMLTFAANIYFWRHYRVNYPFIFGFKQGTELGYRDVFMLSAALAVLGLACFLANLQIGLISKTRYSKTATELVPLVFVMIVLAIIICPLNIVYRSSRLFFIRCLFHCICAPLYKVTLPDFFLADHLTSQVQAIRCLELYICYYGLGEYSQRQNKCHNHGVYNTFYFVVAIIPFCFRFMQCVRRLCEDKDVVHAFNGLKYLLTIVAVLIRTAFELREGSIWLVLALLSSIVATVMSTFWDIVMDWGLLRRNSKNFYLRDKLLVSHKSVYYFAMGLNIVLRLAWTKLVLDFNLRPLHQMATTTVISCLEILRRGIWSFFRLESLALVELRSLRGAHQIDCFT